MIRSIIGPLVINESTEAGMISPVPHEASQDEGRPTRTRSDVYSSLKRAGDLVFSGLMLVPGLPLILLAMILVKLSSRGPAIYTQVRVGKDGRPFVIFKIRTMGYNCERNTGPRWADLGRDPRVTRIGSFLRKSHLDELPQLLNVLRGDMSLVGPRPERPEFVSQLELAIPHYRARLDSRPGVTGLAQLLLPPDTDVHSVRAKLSYDLYYLRNAGHWLDFKLVACTLLKVVGVPKAVSRRILGVPEHSVIEGAYEAIATTPTRPREFLEMQPAF